MANRPEAEVDITTELVRRLLDSQFPELAELDISELSRGWDNTNFRLGTDHLVRVPHRAVAAPLLINEQRWLPELAVKLDMPIPAPTHAGTPTDFYPWPWSVTPWFEGTEAARAQLTDPDGSAEALGRFYQQLHVPGPDPEHAPTNPFRGGPLTDRGESFERNLDLLDPSWDRPVIARQFNEACEVELASERVWLHGDLHARNVVVHQGRIAAIVDWGDICCGDRATDLAGAFMLVPDHLALVQRISGASDADWQRARGWAISFAVIYLTHSDDEPTMQAIGTQLFAALGILR